MCIRDRGESARKACGGDEAVPLEKRMFDGKGGEQNGYMVLGTGICQDIFCLCDDSVCVAVCGIPGLLKRQKPHGAVSAS